MVSDKKTKKEVKIVDKGLSYKLPHDIEVEQTVLGTVIMNSQFSKASGVNYASILFEIIHSNEVFYDDFNKDVFDSIKNLYSSGEHFDLLILSKHMEGNYSHMDIGYKLASMNNTFIVDSFSKYCVILLDLYLRRTIITSCYESISQSLDMTEDSLDILNNMQSKLTQFTNSSIGNTSHSFKELFIPLIDSIFSIKESNGIMGIGSGIDKIDKLTSGWQNTNFIVIAGRPSMGKTTFAINLMVNAIRTGKRVLFFSLESSSTEIMIKILSCVTGYSFSDIKSGNLTSEQISTIQEKATPFYNDKLIIDDSISNISSIRSKAMAMNLSKKIDMIIIDYMQLITSDSTNRVREQEVSEISRKVKKIAKELNIPVIGLSQLNRAAEARSDKRPMLSDLRESGAIEQDADIVGFLYRPEYYIKDDLSLKGIVEFIVSKNRNGKTGTIEIKANLEKNKFYSNDIEYDL